MDTIRVVANGHGAIGNRVADADAAPLQPNMELVGVAGVARWLPILGALAAGAALGHSMRRRGGRG